jgi:hypothetical protein
MSRNPDVEIKSPAPQAFQAILIGAVGVLFMAAGAVHAAVEDSAKELARGSSESLDQASVGKSDQDKMDPVTRALYQALDERARSQKEFERHDALGRPKEIREKKQLQIELGDELGGGAFPLERSSRQVRSRGLELQETLPAIEAKLDRESREIRHELRRERTEEHRKERSAHTRSKLDGF